MRAVTVSQRAIERKDRSECVELGAWRPARKWEVRFGVTATSALDAEGVHGSCSHGVSRVETRDEDARCTGCLLLCSRLFDVEDEGNTTSIPAGNRVHESVRTRQGEQQLTASQPYSVEMEGSRQI